MISTILRRGTETVCELRLAELPACHDEIDVENHGRFVVLGRRWVISWDEDGTLMRSAVLFVADSINTAVTS